MFALQVRYKLWESFWLLNSAIMENILQINFKASFFSTKYSKKIFFSWKCLGIKLSKKQLFYWNSSNMIWNIVGLVLRSRKEKQLTSSFQIKFMMKNKKGECLGQILTPGHHHRHQRSSSTIILAPALLFTMVLCSVEIEASLDVSGTTQRGPLKSN